MFKLEKKLKSGVRIGTLTTPHGKIETPFFMPVGTVGSVKSVSPEELKELGAQIVLSNTYHLFLRPGEKLVKKLGGLHKFMNWDGPILTDSGGYQAFSLSEKKYQITNIKSQINPKSQIKNAQTSLVKITEDGVLFRSFLDGSEHLFTPERVIQIQLDLGVDIIMPLDVCPSGKATKEEVKKACKTTIEWAKRSKAYFDRKLQETSYKKQANEEFEIDESNVNCRAYRQAGKLKIVNSKVQRPLLHGIVQGGLFPDLRKWCAEELIKLDFDGYSIGGLAVDHETRDMWKTVKLMGEILPVNKQRYLMGVGTPDDIVKATALGMDMFDCVLPTRLARHGSVFVKKRHSEFISESLHIEGSRNEFGMTGYYKLINLLNSKYREDGGVIDEKCGCPACLRGKSGYSVAYVSHLLRSKEILGLRLTTLHNLYTYLNLMSGLTEGNSFQDNEEER